MIAPGDTLAPFTLLDAQGKPHRWQPGTITLITVVALWCDTWKEQTARLAAARKALAGLPVSFLTIAIDGRWAERGRGLEPLGRDLDGAWSRRWGIQAVPFTILVDAKGTVCYAAQGIGRAEELTTQVRNTLSSRAAAKAGVYFTFDDFPQRDDDLLLDLLRREGVKVTFFCLGAHLEDEVRAAIARRALAEGHSLQVHSWNHDADKPQLTRCVAALKRLGATPTLYRAPGHVAVVRLSGEALPLATITPFDETRPGEAELRRRLLLALRPGIVLLHAGVAETRAVLPDVLEAVRRRGWQTARLG